MSYFVKNFFDFRPRFDSFFAPQVIEYTGNICKSKEKYKMAKPMLGKNTAFLRAPSKSDILPSALLFLASRAAVMGVFPFGAPFFAACFDKTAAYLGITVMYLGLLSAGAAGSAVKYMMAALIFWLFINLYSGRSRAAAAAACGASMFVSGMASMFYSFSGAYDIFILFIESAVCGIMYAVFSGARDCALRRAEPRSSAQEELLSLSAAAGVFILGLGRTELPFGISAANIIAVYAVLTAAGGAELSGAALSGLVIGFITGGGRAVELMGAFGLSSVFGGFLKSFGRIGTAVGFIGGACAVLLCAGTAGSLPYSVWDVLIGAALFAATPAFVYKKFLPFFASGRRAEPQRDEERLKTYISERLKSCAGAFRSLEGTFVSASESRARSSAPSREDIFSETAGRICGDCPRRSKCWDKEYEKTVSGMAELLNITEEKGGVTINSMPLSFRERCMRPERMLIEFGHAYELYKLSLAENEERRAARGAAAAQYRETAELLDGIARELEDDFEFCRELEDKAAAAFEAAGITVYEISIAASSRAEVYIRMSDSSRVGMAEGILSEVMGVNMGFDREENGGLYFVSAPRFSVDIGVRQLSKEDGCGDTVSVFGTDKYKLCCMICDGMGTGGRAAEESAVTAELLKKLLKAGFGVRTAVETVNSAMCMRTEDDYFTTLDLLCIDLMSGAAEFFKIGAARSLIYRRGGVETVFSAAFPIGAAPFTEVLPQLRRAEDGDVVIMASDGITEAGEIKTEWLRKQIKAPVLSMQAMADGITEKALERNNGEVCDDMSVIALKITEN